MYKGKRKHFQKALALFLAVSMILTGCGDKEDYSQYRVEIPIAAQSSLDTQGYSQKYLSEGICVIPAKKQSKQDSFMTAQAAYLIDNTHHKMIYSQGIYKKMYPASITKIVTALVALKYGNLKDEVTISYEASHITEYGAKLCGFAEGDKVSLETLLYSLLVCSGNDAGIAIAEHISGSVEEFANLMNKEMQEIGATGSHFTNPHGLHDDDHYTTAYDLYLVFQKLLGYGKFRKIINQAIYTAKFHDKDGNEKQLSFSSTDRYLLRSATAPEGVTVIGGKTGTTEKAGSNLILYTQNEKGTDYISIVMHADGAYSLYEQMNHLLAMEIK